MRDYTAVAVGTNIRRFGTQLPTFLPTNPVVVMCFTEPTHLLTPYYFGAKAAFAGSASGTTLRNGKGTAMNYRGSARVSKQTNFPYFLPVPSASDPPNTCSWL